MELAFLNDKAKLTGWNSEDYNNPPAAKLKYPKIVKGAFRHLKPVGMFKEHWVLFSLEIKTGKFLGGCPGPKCVDPQLRLKISISCW